MLGKGKINVIRTFALGLVFGGLVVTYGSFLVESTWAMMLFIVLGTMMVIASTVVYFIVGLLSTKAVVVQCPTCEKTTKVLGRTDQCMHCRETLTLDPDLANQSPDTET